MSNISFTCKIQRKVILDPQLTDGKVIIIGEVEEYVKTDNEIKVNIKLFEDLPPGLLEAVTKNPGCIRISEAMSPPQDIIHMPSRPKLVT